jgi:hypothetical protein
MSFTAISPSIGYGLVHLAISLDVARFLRVIPVGNYKILNALRQTAKLKNKKEKLFKSVLNQRKRTKIAPNS